MIAFGTYWEALEHSVHIIIDSYIVLSLSSPSVDRRHENARLYSESLGTDSMSIRFNYSMISNFIKLISGLSSYSR